MRRPPHLAPTISGGGSFSATAFSQNVTVGGNKGDSAVASSASAGSTSQAAAQNASQNTGKSDHPAAELTITANHPTGPADVW